MSAPAFATSRSQQCAEGAALPRLHIVTDTRRGRDPLPDVGAALAAACALRQTVAIQVRAKDATDRELLDLSRRVVDLVERAGTAGSWVVVDDRVDIASATGAAGVHLGAHDLPVEAARRLVGDRLAVGGTARTPEAGHAAHRAGASYLGVGPVFATTTKTGLPDPLGVPGVEAVARSSPVPVIAIGGVSSHQVPALLRAGAHGVAVVTAVSTAADPQAATAALLRAIEVGA